MQKDSIITVSQAQFTLGPNDIPITAVELHLSLNSIPCCVVTFPPHVYSSKKYDIQAPGLTDVRSIMDTLYSLARKETTANLTLTLQGTGDFKTQTLSCKNWILGDVALSSASVTTGFVIACKIYHPAYKLLKHGYFAGSLDAPLPLSSVGTQCTDLVDAADTVVKQLADAVLRDPSNIDLTGVPHASSYEDIQSKIKSLVEKIEADALPSKYLSLDVSFDKSFDYNINPLHNISLALTALNIDVESALSLAMCSSFMPSETTSVWDAFLSACGLWGYSIIPTYDQSTLTVFPRSPWGKPTYIISESHIASITLPAYDSNPVLGVKSSSDIFGPDESFSTTNNNQSIEDVTQGELIYIPEGNLDELTGRLQPITMPPWLSVLQQAAASLRETVADGVTNDPDKVDVDEGNTEDLMSAIYSSWVRFAAYAFQDAYKQSYAAGMTLPLCIDSATLGGTKSSVYPGLSLRITGSEKKGVIDGYITDVTHRIDINSGTGVTAININHCRPPGGYPGIAEEGDGNPLYL